LRSDRPRPGEEPEQADAGGPAAEPDLRAWLEARIARIHRIYEGRGVPFRVLWVVVAVLVVVFELMLTVIPGPAVVVIPLALAMLAAAFGWAHRLLTVSVQRLPAAGRPAPRRLGLTLLLLAAAAVAAGAALMFLTARG
jgi:hypothetical protein